jgi:hypothetical protein
MRLFLSYARADAELAVSLATSLRARGMDVFVDQDRLKGGDDFVERLAREIERRDGVLLLLTPAGAESRWVQGEAAWALQCGKKVVPIVLDGTTLLRFLFLSHLQQVRLTGTDSAALEHVVSALHALFGSSSPQAGSHADSGSLAVTIRGVAEDEPAAALMLARRTAELEPAFLDAHGGPNDEQLTGLLRTSGMTAEASAVYRHALSASAARAFDAMEALLAHAARRFGLRDDPLHLLGGRVIRPALAPFFSKLRTLPVKGDRMAFTSQGTHLLLCDDDELLFADVTSGAITRRRSVGPGPFGLWLRKRTKWNMRFKYRGYVRAFALTPLEDAVIFGRDDGRWGLWSLREDSVRWFPRVHRSIDFVFSDGQFAACHPSGAPHLIGVPLEGFPLKRRLRDRNSSEEMSQITASRKHVFTARGNRIRMWGDDEGPLFVISTPRRRIVSDLHVSANGRYLGAIVSDGFVNVWSLPDLNPVSETATGSDQSYTMRLSPDASILYASDDDEITGFDRLSGRRMLRIPRTTRNFAVSPLGDLLAVEGSDGTELWGLL